MSGSSQRNERERQVDLALSTPSPYTTSIMNEQLKTIKAEGAEWVRLTKDQAERIGLGYCWAEGLLVNVEAYHTGMTPDAIFFNAHPQGRHPACSYYEWSNSSFAPDDLVDVLVATQNKFVNK